MAGSGFAVDRRTPLSPEERERVYELQVWLGCVRRCDKCGQLEPLDGFLRNGDPRCERCRIEDQTASGAAHVRAGAAATNRKRWGYAA